MYPTEYIVLLSFYIIMAIFIILSLSIKNRSHIERKKDIKLFFRDESGGETVKICDMEKVYCIDDCSFLCLNGEKYHCVENICVVKSSQKNDNDDCHMGIKLLIAGTKSGIPQWQCLCTKPTIFTGKYCDKTIIDVCEHGIFLFGEDEFYNCICNPPYSLMWDEDKKPHCLETHWDRFFKG